MAGKAKYLMIASMDVDPEHDAIFNEVYDKEHVPNLMKVPGVLGVSRYKRGTLTMNIGGERKTIELPNEPSTQRFMSWRARMSSRVPRGTKRSRKADGRVR